MASRFSKIKRAISSIKDFLDYNRDEYSEAARNIRPGQGWNVLYFDDELYRVMEQLEYGLYEELYPKLTDEVETPDKQIMSLIAALIKAFEKDLDLFQKMVEASDDGMLFSIAGTVQELVVRALRKLEETLEVANEDLKKAPAELSKSYFDIGIITATSAEFDAVHGVLKSPTRLQTEADDANTYYEGVLEGGNKSIKVIFAMCSHQGGSAAAVLTTKMVYIFRPPIVFMLGHAAGNRNLAQNLKIGDIMVAETSVDYDQVTVIQRKTDDGVEVIEKDRKHELHADPTVIERIHYHANHTDALARIRAGYTGQAKFEANLKLHKGKLITGNALVRSEDWFNKIVGDNAGTVGLDMETYSFYYAAEHTVFRNKPIYISIKSASDYGGQTSAIPDEIKDPTIRVPYAIYTSVSFFVDFILENWPLR